MKKVAKKNKKVTIDVLAIMVAKGFGDVEKRFEGVEKDISNNTKISNLILKEISAIHEDNKHFRETVASLNIDGISYNRRIENLTIRVEALEDKKK